LNVKNDSILESNNIEIDSPGNEEIQKDIRNSNACLDKQVSEEKPVKFVFIQSQKERYRGEN